MVLFKSNRTSERREFSNLKVNPRHGRKTGVCLNNYVKHSLVHTSLTKEGSYDQPLILKDLSCMEYKGASGKYICMLCVMHLELTNCVEKHNNLQIGCRKRSICSFNHMSGKSLVIQTTKFKLNRRQAPIFPYIFDRVQENSTYSYSFKLKHIKLLA